MTVVLSAKGTRSHLSQKTVTRTVPVGNSCSLIIGCPQSCPFFSSLIRASTRLPNWRWGWGKPCLVRGMSLSSQEMCVSEQPFYGFPHLRHLVEIGDVFVVAKRLSPEPSQSLSMPLNFDGECWHVGR